MKLFVFDVDGTLVHDGGEISQPVRESIQRRLDMGDAIAIASGRPFIGINKYLSLFKGGIVLRLAQMVQSFRILLETFLNVTD